jgi:sugar-specific transcriptional regulator TrmB
MNTKELLQAFIDTGWTRQEAKLYVLLLELGAQPASVLAKQINKNRVTVLHALERMLSKGWLSKSKATYGWRYSANSPGDILQTLADQRDELHRKTTQKVELFEGLLPSLTKIEGVHFKKPTVEVFYGTSALKQLYALSLESSEMHAYYEPWDLKTYPELLAADDWHTEQRIKKQISVKIILPGTKHAKRFAEVQKFLKEAVVVPDDMFSMKDITIITDTGLLIYSLEDKMGISIVSSNIAQNQKQQFMLAWKQAKRVGKYFG